MWILLDNYDSFTHILHHYLLQSGNDCTVYRNDELSLQELIDKHPTRLIISPGPETPLQAGICMNAIAHFHDKVPILGICLGHQALGMHYGAELTHAPYPMHGKMSPVKHNGHELFKNIDEQFLAMRYHSLVLNNVQEKGMNVIATAGDDQTIMAIAHPTHPNIGIQFHPESVGTTAGLQIIKNWASMY